MAEQTRPAPPTLLWGPEGGAAGSGGSRLRTASPDAGREREASNLRARGCGPPPDGGAFRCGEELAGRGGPGAPRTPGSLGLGVGARARAGPDWPEEPEPSQPGWRRRECALVPGNQHVAHAHGSPRRTRSEGLAVNRKVGVRAHPGKKPARLGGFSCLAALSSSPPFLRSRELR